MCPGGTPTSGTACSEHDALQCSACDAGHWATGADGAFGATLGARRGVPARPYTFLEMKLTSRRVPFFEPCMYMKLTTSPGLQRLRTRSVPCDGCADETGGDPLPREPLPVRR